MRSIQPNNIYPDNLASWTLFLRVIFSNLRDGIAQTDINNRCYLHGHIFHARLTVDNVSRKLTAVKNCKKHHAKPARGDRQQKQWHLQNRQQKQQQMHAAQWRKCGAKMGVL